MPDPEYIARYGPGPHEAADAVVLDLRGRAALVLLIQRRDGIWALPGGFLEPAETHEEAACRELHEETGLVVYPDRAVARVRRAERDRDPRAWIRTTAYAFLTDLSQHPAAGDDAVAVAWWPVYALPKMYADHESIVAEIAVAIVAGRAEETDLD